MSKLYFYKPLPAALKKTESVSTEPITIQGRIAPSSGPQQGQFVDVTMTADPGSTNFVISRAKLRERGLEDFPIEGKMTSQLADGSFQELDMALFDIKLSSPSKDDPTFFQIAAAITDGDANDEILLGRDILAFYNIGIENGRLTLFQPNQEALAQLEPWTPQASKAKKISAALDEVIKGSSVLEPLQPIAEKKPELPKVPEVPSIGNEWALPKPSQGLMPTMPNPPTPGKPLPKPK